MHILLEKTKSSVFQWCTILSQIVPERMCIGLERLSLLFPCHVNSSVATESFAVFGLQDMFDGIMANVLDMTVTVLNKTAVVLDVTVTVQDMTAVVLDVTVTAPDMTAVVLDVTVTVPDMTAVVLDVTVTVPDMTAVVLDMAVTGHDSYFVGCDSYCIGMTSCINILKVTALCWM